MSDQDPNSLEETPQPGAGDPGGGDPGQGAAPNAGGEPAGGDAPPPPPDDWAGVPDNIRQAVEKRLGAMTAKNKTLEEELAQLRSGSQPAAGARGGEGGEGGEGEGAPFAAYDSWKRQALGNDPKAIALFDGFHKAIMDDVNRAVVWYVGSQVEPLSKGHGDIVAEGFYRGNPAAQAKRQEIEAKVKQVPGLSREDAWKILNYGAPPPRPPKTPPPGQRPGAPGAPSAPKDLPRGKGFGAIVEAVADRKGL